MSCFGSRGMTTIPPLSRADSGPLWLLLVLHGRVFRAARAVRSTTVSPNSSITNHNVADVDQLKRVAVWRTNSEGDSTATSDCGPDTTKRRKQVAEGRSEKSREGKEGVRTGKYRGS